MSALSWKSSFVVRPERRLLTPNRNPLGDVLKIVGPSTKSSMLPLVSPWMSMFAAWAKTSLRRVHRRRPRPGPRPRLALSVW